MTKRRPVNHKKPGRARRHWLPQLGGGGAVAVVVGVVILAVFGMTQAGGNQSVAPDVTPVTEEKTEGEATPHLGGPAMAFDVTSVDFGDVPLNTPVTYSFPFTNTGDATLQIEDVQVKTLEGC